MNKSIFMSFWHRMGVKLEFQYDDEREVTRVWYEEDEEDTSSKENINISAYYGLEIDAEFDKNDNYIFINITSHP